MGYQYLKNVVTLEYHPEKCAGCGMCIQVCPHQVFTLKEKKAVILNRDHCIECGACAKNCPFSAINVAVGVGCAQAVFKTMFSRNQTAEECT